MHAARIRDVCLAHNVPISVWTPQERPTVLRYPLTLGIGTPVRKLLNLREEIAAALEAPSVTLQRERGAVYLDVPREDRQTVHLTDLLKALHGAELPDGVVGVVGMNLSTGRPHLWHLGNPNTPHALVAGTSGSGKTELVKSLAVSMATICGADELSLLVIDPKGGMDLGSLADLPHVMGDVVTDVEEGTEALMWLAGEMDQRYVSQSWDTAIVVVIDELADLMMLGGPDLEAALVRIGQKGRGAQVHLLAATQKPSAAVITGRLKVNLRVRLVGAQPSPEDAKNASGIAGTGAENLLGRGDFLVVNGGKTRIQAALTRENDIEHVRRLHDASV